MTIYAFKIRLKTAKLFDTRRNFRFMQITCRSPYSFVSTSHVVHFSFHIMSTSLHKLLHVVLKLTKNMNCKKATIFTPVWTDFVSEIPRGSSRLHTQQWHYVNALLSSLPLLNFNPCTITMSVGQKPPQCLVLLSKMTYYYIREALFQVSDFISKWESKFSHDCYEFKHFSRGFRLS